MKINHSIHVLYVYVQLATQGATTFIAAGERLTQELRVIEAGIRESESNIRSWSDSYDDDTDTTTIPWIQQSNTDYKPEEVAHSMLFYFVI